MEIVREDMGVCTAISTSPHPSYTKCVEPTIRNGSLEDLLRTHPQFDANGIAPER